MKIALITTTINVPTVLSLYRKLGPDVHFFVAVDRKTPDAAMDFLHELPNTRICQGDQYKCSELISWDNDSRRNIALLEAVKWGADIIFSCDDDMIPLGLDFFSQIERVLSIPYYGLQVSAPSTQWVDVGAFTFPQFPQRGLPVYAPAPHAFSFATDVAIGAMQGIILGVPDTNAEESALDPFVRSVDDILRNGFVVHSESKAVFNSQITAFRRELAPCFAQYYNWQKRNTDILASLVMRRVMRELALRTYFGPPFAFHARNPAFRSTDYENERPGMEIIERFSECLDQTILPPGSVVKQTRHLYEALNATGLVSDEMLACVEAFLEDIEPLL